MSTLLATPLNVEFLLDQVGGNTKIAKRVMEEFAYHTPMDLDYMKQRLTASDLTMAEMIARYIRIDSGMLGAVQLRDIAADLEIVCQTNNVKAALRIFHELCEELARCIEYISAMIRQLDDWHPEEFMNN